MQSYRNSWRIPPHGQAMAIELKAVRVERAEIDAARERIEALEKALGMASAGFRNVKSALDVETHTRRLRDQEIAGMRQELVELQQECTSLKSENRTLKMLGVSALVMRAAQSVKDIFSGAMTTKTIGMTTISTTRTPHSQWRGAFTLPSPPTPSSMGQEKFHPSQDSLDVLAHFTPEPCGRPAPEK